MKHFTTVVIASLAALTVAAVLTAATAWAQLGTYGSPGMFNGSPTYSSLDRFDGSAGLPYASTTRTLAAVPAPPKAADTNPRLLGASLIDRMLSQSSYGGPSPAHRSHSAADNHGSHDHSHDHIGPVIETLQDCGQDECGGCGERGGCGECMQQTCSPWYGSVTALVMGRNNANRLWTTYETGNNPNQLKLDTHGWSWGAEIKFGRKFCHNNNQYALEAIYWALDGFEGMASRTHANSVSTPLIVSGIEFGANNGTIYFDNAVEHRLWRANEVHSIELNLVRYPFQPGCNLSWNTEWSLGLRYFRFEDSLVFGSLADATLAPWNLGAAQTWGAGGGIYEAYLDERVQNDLFGFQFGCNVAYNVTPSLQLFLTPKVGIYNNHIDHTFNAYLGDGTIANPTAASGVTGTYPVRSIANVVSFLTQIDVGAEWQFAPRWSVRGGYRAVVATGIGLADNQIPTYVVDIPELASIDHNGELILHGAFVGLTYNF